MNSAKCLTDLASIVSCFRILHDWKIEEGVVGDYEAQVIVDDRKKTAIICPWGEGEPPADYLFHEVLHVALRAYRLKKRRKGAEETLVQDLCVLFFPSLERHDNENF